MKTKQKQTLDAYGIYGTHTTKAGEEESSIIIGNVPAGLNIALEIPAMIMFRHLVFGVVIGRSFKPFFEEKK